MVGLSSFSALYLTLHNICYGIECKYLQRNLCAAVINEAIGHYKGLSAAHHAFVTNTLSPAAGNCVVACFSSDDWHKRMVPSSSDDESQFLSIVKGVFKQYIIE